MTRTGRRHRYARTLGGVLLALAAGMLAACGGGSTGPAVHAPDPGGNPQQEPETGEIFEDFDDTTYLDTVASNADWGVGESSVLRNQSTTSRHAYVYTYPLTIDPLSSTSGRGQYVEAVDVLTGTDLETEAPQLPASLGRRNQWAFSDTEIGAAGSITAAAWGPAENGTIAASYPNVKLRMGYQASGSLSLGTGLSENYAADPTVVYDGPYTVQEITTVGNTAGQPASAHVGGYPQNPGCLDAGPHNEPLYAFTGWYPWPAFTTPFDWDPGDPDVENDRRLVFDASVQAGSATQKLRGWFAVTYPCSGLLIGGWPETTVSSGYEGDYANPPDNFPAGIVNPMPAAVDTRFTLTQLVSVGQSLFFEADQGDAVDYGTPALVPAAQAGDAVVALQFQGADAVENDGRTIDTSEAYTEWTSDIDDCDGMRYLRFRFLLTPDPVSLARARVDSIRIPTSSTSE